MECDMCGTLIVNGKCSCGIWKSAEEMRDDPMKMALEKFHEMKKFTFTCDAPHLGAAMILFRGNYNDCNRIVQFIYSMNNRPYYSEEL